MFLAYYEQAADEKDHVLFNKVRIPRTRMADHLPHFHGLMEIAVGLDGETDIFINGKKYELKRGTICFVNPLDTHAYYYKEGTERFVVGIPYEVVERAFGDDKKFPACVECGAEFDIICNFLEIAYVNWENDPIYRTGFFNMFLALLMKFYLVNDANGDEKYDEDWVEIIKYINRNCNKDITAESVASEFKYSPNYFSNVFNKLMGVNFREYLNFCRMAQYKKLVKENPKLTSAEAAELCGFGSLKSFYRARRRIEEMDRAQHIADN